MEKNKPNNKEASKLYSDSYFRAKKKVENLKGFYIHLFVYLTINSIFTYIIIVENIESGATFSEAFLNSENFGLWMVWGIGLVIHGINVFINDKFGQDWEERKIRKFMNEETRNWE